MPAIAARLLALALLIALPPAAFALDDSPENRAVEADRYLAAVPPQTMLNDVSSKMAESLPEEQRAAFTTLMTKHLDVGHISAAIKAAMVKTFTADELKALADFYGSDVGKSAMAKMGAYMSEVMPATMTEVQNALEKAQADIHKERPAQARPDEQNNLDGVK